MFRSGVATAMLVILASCASTDVAKSWEGENVDNLIMSWGGPDRDYRLPNGGRELRFTHERFVDGSSYYCTVTFQTTPQGRVVKAQVDGNIGGCNRLLGSKPAIK